MASGDERCKQLPITGGFLLVLFSILWVPFPFFMGVYRSKAVKQIGSGP